MNTSSYAFSVIAAGLLVIPPAYAEDYSILNDPWRIYIGAFDATVDTTVAINGDTLPPVPPINVEDVLGVEDGKTVAWGGVRWRFAERHGVELEVFTLHRSGSRTDTYSPPIQIGDSFIEAGQIGTEYDTDVIRLTYAYSVFRNERSDFQLKGGLHFARLNVDVNLAAFEAGRQAAS